MAGRCKRGIVCIPTDGGAIGFAAFHVPPHLGLQGDAVLKMDHARALGQILCWTAPPTLASLLQMRTDFLRTVTRGHCRRQMISPRSILRPVTNITKSGVAVFTVLSLHACASAPAPSAGPPTSVTPGRPPAGRGPGVGTIPVSRLPAVPAVRGATLDVKVRYPSDNHLLTTRDSNFILGSLGSGDVTLTINGVSIPVAPNGAFLGWVANPSAMASRYDLVVARGVDTVRRTVRIRYGTRLPLPASGKLIIDSGTLQPSSRTRVRPDELVRVSVRAPNNASLWVEGADGVRRPLIPLARTQATAIQALAGKVDPIVPVPVNGTQGASGEDVGVTFATDVVGRRLAARAQLIAVRGGDTIRLPIPAIQINDPESRVLAMLRSTSTIGADTDRVVNARTVPDGTYKWLLHPGTVLEVTGRQNGSTRVQLDPSLDVWVANEDLVTLPEGTAMPRRVTGGLRVTPSADWVDLAIPVGERPAFLVEPDGKTLVLTLYGVQVNPEISPILGNDTLIRRISWDQVTSDRARITLTLSRPVYGWLSLWDESRRALVLRVRRIPTIDPAHPLAALTIAVDPGHPPAGATGPTGLYEGDAVLPVGKLVADLLRERGANPVLTRTTLGPVGLTERGVASRRADAHAFVSIHLNALPDGVNPFTANGTSTLFYHQPSEPLARLVETELVARFGLRDLGVHYQNLAVARPSWYPAVLTEGLFVMLPEQEAAMRDVGFQRRYAEAIVAGLEAYFRELSKQ